MPLTVQYIVVGLVVALALWIFLKKQMPGTLRRLRLAAPADDGADDALPGSTDPAPLGATSLPEPTSAQRSAVGLAIRAVAERAGTGLPAPWATAVAAAARSRLADLPDLLDRAITATDLGIARRPVWWRLVNGVQWLATAAAVVGLAWLVLGYLVRALGLPRLEYPMVGMAPLPTVLLLGGLLLGVLVAALTRPVVRWAAGWARWRAESRMHRAVAETAHEQVIAPVREVLRRYAEARAALTEASAPSAVPTDRTD